MYSQAQGADILDGIDGIWFQGAKEWFRVEDLLIDDSGLIEGTSGNDVLAGSDGDDTMIGNGGSDVFRGSLGDDDIIGNDGAYDELSLAGSEADYTFTANGDGTITVTGDLIGTDTLTSIEGVWFRGAQDWANINELIEVESGLIEGTAGDDVLYGSDSDDTMIGNGGRDVFRGSLGNDQIIGTEAGYDELSLAGSASDYTFTQNADGTVTVTGALIGTDILTHIDGVWFRGSQSWFDIDDMFG
jgi:Ca2+-binding RTX toxin-like protein